MCCHKVECSPIVWDFGFLAKLKGMPANPKKQTILAAKNKKFQIAI